MYQFSSLAFSENCSHDRFLFSCWQPTGNYISIKFGGMLPLGNEASSVSFVSSSFSHCIFLPTTPSLCLQHRTKVDIGKLGVCLALVEASVFCSQPFGVEGYGLFMPKNDSVNLERKRSPEMSYIQILFDQVHGFHARCRPRCQRFQRPAPPALETLYTASSKCRVC